MSMAAAMTSGKRRRVYQEATVVKVNPVLSDLTDDAILEILSRLPVKDLLRFRCVCKSWDSVISDPKFPKFHRCKRTCLFLIDNNHLIKVGYQEELENIIDYGLIPNPRTTMYPSYVPIPGCHPNWTYAKLLGSCNGLMCFLTRTMVVWNPCTGKFKILPELSAISFNCCWFGYDKSVDDYKLIVSEGSEVQILTLKSNSWRKVITKDVNFGYGTRCDTAASGTLLAGNVHWLVGHSWLASEIENSESFIAVLDLSTEKIRKLSKPDLDPGHNVSEIGGLGGCLYLCSCFFDSHHRFWNELWIMKEYGMVSSWKKLATFLDSELDFRFDFTPLYYAKEDEIVAFIDNRIAGKAWIGRLNITDVSLHKLLVSNTLPVSSLAYQSVMHMESLVSVDAEQHG